MQARGGGVRAHVSSGSMPAMPHFNFGRVQARCGGCLLRNRLLSAVRLFLRRASSFLWKLQASPVAGYYFYQCPRAARHGDVPHIYMLVVVCGERAVGDRDCVSLCSGELFHS